MKLLAILLAWATFAVIAKLRHRWLADHPSPGEGPGVIDWVKALVRGDRDPEPDPEPARRRKGYRLHEVSENRTEVEWIDYNNLPPAMPEPEPEEPEIRRWIRASFDAGARYGRVLTEGQRAFRVSESTMKREIRKARASRS